MIPLHHFAALILTCLFAAGCGGSSDPRELVNAGNTELGSGNHKAALDKFVDAQTALAGKTDDPLYHAAKLGAIDARIKLDAKTAAGEFLEYAKTAPSKVRDSDFIDISGKLASANATPEALRVVKAGAETYAASEKMKAQEQRIVELAKQRAAAGDEGTKSALAGLGYLGGK
ncbi:MAG: hypothetical protein EPO68_09580 [Planctomycetota bacterium]|nr:MAG: hypothetical protein EPO68_09580 [Planctomycetota bacterium]